MADSTESSTMVNAAPIDVLDVIAEIGEYPEWTEGISSAEVLAEDEDGWPGKARFSLSAGPVTDTYTLDYTWDIAEDGTGTVSWTLDEALMLKAMDGSYVLRAVDGGTHVTYRLSVDLKVPMLGMLRRKAEKTIINFALDGLRKRAGA